MYLFTKKAVILIFEKLILSSNQSQCGVTVTKIVYYVMQQENHKTGNVIMGKPKSLLYIIGIQLIFKLKFHLGSSSTMYKN